jgi:hypothetical protein
MDIAETSRRLAVEDLIAPARGVFPSDPNEVDVDEGTMRSGQP